MRKRGRKNRNRSAKKRIRNLKERIKNRFSITDDEKEVQVVFNQDASNKISDKLADVAYPMLELAETSIEAEKAVMLASAIWNSARNDESKESVLELFPESRSEIEPIIDVLYSRAEKYNDDPRLVVDATVEDTGNMFHIQVASTMPKTNNDDE